MDMPVLSANAINIFFFIVYMPSVLLAASAHHNSIAHTHMDLDYVTTLIESNFRFDQCIVPQFFNPRAAKQTVAAFDTAQLPYVTEASSL